ncbi:MAG: polyphosphate polymerase domain-containing protein [Clostridia bacterium]|nr:polyphosphate polymerase domain-containing protein [Clostridia bacterium]
MNYQAVFKRCEIKYLINAKQKAAILSAIAPYMELDKYGRTTIRNIYYDTDSYLLIRRSIEKPVFKEKLRIRSYCKTDGNSTVFVEIKKKYKHVVYKRRLTLPENEAMEWIATGRYPKEPCQISNEIDYFIKHYGTLKPSVFLSYEREAYYDKNGSDFRVTFDENILCRKEDMLLSEDPWGEALLEDGQTMMEIKTSGGIPLWMTKVLTELGVFKTSFSKYGNYYRNTIFPEIKGGFLYA